MAHGTRGNPDRRAALNAISITNAFMGVTQASSWTFPPASAHPVYLSLLLLPKTFKGPLVDR